MHFIYCFISIFICSFQELNRSIHVNIMKKSLRMLSLGIFPYLVLLLFVCGSCGDSIKHIETQGMIVAKDSCSVDGKKGWIVNVIMSETILPRKDMAFPLGSDTVNNVRYNALVRVYCSIQEPDSVIFKKRFSVFMTPYFQDCESSRFRVSSYNGSTYGFSK